MSDQAAQPEPGQDPTPPQLSDSPWRQAIESSFADPAIAAQVDQFLAKETQPYITKLEQEKAQATDKAWVYDKFEADPDSAFRDIAEQFYGEDVTQQIEAILAGTENPVDDDTTVGEVAAVLPPEVQEQLAWVAQQRQLSEQQAQQQAFRAELDQYLADKPGVETDLLIPFVAASDDGDFDKALGRYRTFETQLLEAAQARAAEEAGNPAPPANAPNTPAAPNTVPNYGLDIGRAIDDAFDEWNAAPPTV